MKLLKKTFSFSDDYRDWTYYHRAVTFTPPKDVSLLGWSPIQLPYTVDGGLSFAFSDSSQLSFPYLQDNGSPILMHANMAATSAFGGLIRTGGSIRWAHPADYPYSVYIFIRE